MAGYWPWAFPALLLVLGKICLQNHCNGACRSWARAQRPNLYHLFGNQLPSTSQCLSSALSCAHLHQIIGLVQCAGVGCLIVDTCVLVRTAVPIHWHLVVDGCRWLTSRRGHSGPSHWLNLIEFMYFSDHTSSPCGRSLPVCIGACQKAPCTSMSPLGPC